jgi:hypothetical protein
MTSFVAGVDKQEGQVGLLQHNISVIRLVVPFIPAVSRNFYGN